MPLTHKTTTTNERTNERMIRPHNLQKSLNKLPSCTCKQNYYMLLPNKEAYQYLDRPAHHRMWLLENDQSPISRTGVWMQTPWGSQNPDKYMMPSQIHASVNSQFFLKHKCPLCITCVFTDGKIFQNRRVSSPAPVTMVCKLRRVILLIFLDIISA